MILTTHVLQLAHGLRRGNTSSGSGMHDNTLAPKGDNLHQHHTMIFTSRLLIPSKNLGAKEKNAKTVWQHLIRVTGFRKILQSNGQI